MEFEILFRRHSYILFLQILSGLIWCISSTSPSESGNLCNFKTDSEKKHFEVLKPLVGLHLQATKKEVPKKEVSSETEYTYYVGICTMPCPHDIKCDPKAGVVQSWVDAKQIPHKKIVGKFDKATLKGTNRWKMLTYDGGDKYETHCVDHDSRRANIMLSCDETKDTPALTVIEENNQRNDSCYYLFEISSKVLCPKKESILPEGVSAGSVIVILLAVGVSCYLIFGCLYRRIVVGAKGVDQVPNLQFWQNFGNLMADGCDFAFRTKVPSNSRNGHVTAGSGGGYEPVTSSPDGRVYKGLGDDILSNSESNSADDSLLPM